MNLFNFFGRFEAFLMYESSALRKRLALIFLTLAVPGPFKFLFIFILVLKLVSDSLSEKRMRILFSLPFSRSEIFIYSFLFGFSLIFSASVLGWALFGRENSAEILKYFIFYSFYFGATLINSIKTGGKVTFVMLFLAFDLVSPFIAPDIYLFLSQYSPLYQQNQPIALLLAAAMPAIAYLLFVFERRKKW